MVRLVVKKAESPLFLLDTSLDAEVSDTLDMVAKIQNGRLKILRICSEVNDLAHHGVFLPPHMLGLLEEQIKELKLKDEYEEVCIPAGGFVFSKDPLGRRSGRAPNAESKELLLKTKADVKTAISADHVKANHPLQWQDIIQCLDKLKGAVSMVYPMGLPEYDPIRMELENREDLSGGQAQKELIDVAQTSLWFATKELMVGKQLKHFLSGANEKSKVIIKVTSKSAGAPAREPLISEEDQKKLLLQDHQRREAMARLERDADDSYLNSPWADQSGLKRRLIGIKDISWK